MRGTFYKVLGFLVWKGFVADMRRRARVAAKRAGVAALVVVAVCGAIALVRWRDGDGH